MNTNSQKLRDMSIRASRERDLTRARRVLNQAVYLDERRHGASPFRARLQVRLFRFNCALRLATITMRRLFA